MSHRLGFVLGVISRAQFDKLEDLKTRAPEEYELAEVRLGITRPQLEARFGEEVVTLADRKVARVWKTNRRTGRRFRR